MQYGRWEKGGSKVAVHSCHLGFATTKLGGREMSRTELPNLMGPSVTLAGVLGELGWACKVKELCSNPLQLWA